MSTVDAKVLAILATAAAGHVPGLTVFDHACTFSWGPDSPVPLIAVGTVPA